MLKNWRLGRVGAIDLQNWSNQVTPKSTLSALRKKTNINILFQYIDSMLLYANLSYIDRGFLISVAIEYTNNAVRSSKTCTHRHQCGFKVIYYEPYYFWPTSSSEISTISAALHVASLETMLHYWWQPRSKQICYQTIELFQEKTSYAYVLHCQYFACIILCTGSTMLPSEASKKKNQRNQEEVSCSSFRDAIPEI